MAPPAVGPLPPLLQKARNYNDLTG